LKKIAVLHPYLEHRLNELNRGLYPRQHLWGLDGLKEDPSFQVSLIDTGQIKINKLLEKFLNKILFRSQSNIRNELAAIKASRKSDLIYSVSGPLGLRNFFHSNTKLVSWVFQYYRDKRLCLRHPYSFKNLTSHNGFLCLTHLAQSSFLKFAESKFVPWCIDLDFFDGLPPKRKPKSNFFLASGKTGRDYKTLVNSAKDTKAEIRIIGPNSQRPKELPDNVNWIETSINPPDQAIDYPTLKEWYAQCSGVCIPLSGDADDTCGYTNMLEGMAMKKPVLMTRSGSLHIDPKSRNFGILIEPKDSQGWANAMNHIKNHPISTRSYGETGRKVVENELTIKRFNQDILQFVKSLISQK